MDEWWDITRETSSEKGLMMAVQYITYSTVAIFSDVTREFMVGVVYPAQWHQLECARLCFMQGYTTSRTQLFDTACSNHSLEEEYKRKETKIL